MDGNDWLTKHRAGHFVPDRVCGAACPAETLKPGDVGEDGGIMSSHGVLIYGGSTAVYLNERKRAAAAYYGWFYAAHLPNGKSDEGEPTYPMMRRL